MWARIALAQRSHPRATILLAIPRTARLLQALMINLTLIHSWVLSLQTWDTILSEPVARLLMPVTLHHVYPQTNAAWHVTLPVISALSSIRHPVWQRVS